MSTELVKGLQERSARALPPTLVKDLDGWWLRYAPGCAWWAGTVLSHSPDETGTLKTKVMEAEAFYTERGQKACFQIAPPACPEGLDALLAERGYRRHSPMSLQIAPTARVLDEASSSPPIALLEGHPTSAWFDAWYSVHGSDTERGAAWDLFARLEQPCAYARVMVGDDLVAVGRALVDTGWAGVFGMATLACAQTKGMARRILTALAHWADGSGAHHLYLQIESGNVAALRLYERIGFRELCTYRYRACR